MNVSNRVDELRKRYHEDPKRYFAPLWYKRVLELQKRNKEVLELLEQVGGCEAIEPPAPAPAPAATPITGTPHTFITETMADLYFKQGFRDRAIDVYRQLIAQRPADVGLRERLAEIERPSLGGGVESAPPPVPAGPSAREFFRAFVERGLTP